MGNSNSSGEEEEESLVNRHDDFEDRDQERSKAEIDENIEDSATFNAEDVSTNFYKIQKELLEAGSTDGKKYMYVDKSFPAVRSSLWKYGMTVSEEWSSIQWQRPQQISRYPQFYRSGISSEDINQGMLGDCWWLAACGAISRSQTRMQVVIPTDQDLVRDPNYAGVFHFRFWRFGEWIEVVIDDKLPVIDGRLCFAHSTDYNEFWIPLLEKAYAKLNGCYRALEGGRTRDGLEDLTGGLAVVYELGAKTPRNLRRILHRALRNGTFVCAGIIGEQGTNALDNRTGLISSHAYSVLNFARVYLNDGSREYLVKIRNPWGGSYEWTQKYSDSSRAWDLVRQKDKQRLQVADEDNGEWWMTYNDFTRYYSDVTLCTMGPDFDGDGKVTGDSWMLSTVKGSWSGRQDTGGSRNDVGAYAGNPQYLINISEADDFDPEEDDPESEGKSTLVIGLMQKDQRAQMAENLYLNLCIYKNDDDHAEPLSKRFFKYNDPVSTSGTYSNVREVTITAQLEPGAYTIVPSSFSPGESGDFLIRIYTEKPISIAELQ